MFHRSWNAVLDEGRQIPAGNQDFSAGSLKGSQDCEHSVVTFMITLCIPVHRWQCFGGANRLHLPGKSR
jgi:hypothetical protein